MFLPSSRQNLLAEAAPSNAWGGRIKQSYEQPKLFPQLRHL